MLCYIEVYNNDEEEELDALRVRWEELMMGGGRVGCSPNPINGDLLYPAESMYRADCESVQVKVIKVLLVQAKPMIW